MFIRAIVVIGLTVAAVGGLRAQQPYSGLEKRSVKALSDQQISDLRAGRGMGMALPAELNGYPGPSHAIELADKLALTGSQLATAQSLFASMKAEAVPVGERLIVQQTDLERHFVDRTITPSLLALAIAEIGATQATLAETHLKYHLAMADLLSPEQRQRYSVLRGYSGGSESLIHQHKH